MPIYDQILCEITTQVYSVYQTLRVVVENGVCFVRADLSSAPCAVSDLNLRLILGRVYFLLSCLSLPCTHRICTKLHKAYKNKVMNRV